MAKYNPEKRAWKGRSYRKGGERVRDLREKTSFTPEETRRELGTMSVRELTAYRNILQMPALRSEATRKLNEEHLAIVLELLGGRAS
jgi:hypothetical protein